jgi:AraC-like DNA-binding protein
VPGIREVFHAHLVDYAYPPLRTALSQLHDRLLHDAEDLDAGARLALIAERITGHLTRAPYLAPAPEPGVAGQLRQLLDEHITGQISLAQAAATLDRTIPHLVRSFTRQFGLSPYAYVTGRRIDAARRLLLQGAAPAYAATAVGFYDQAHLTRHFKRHTATTPPATPAVTHEGPRRRTAGWSQAIIPRLHPPGRLQARNSGHARHVTVRHRRSQRTGQESSIAPIRAPMRVVR